ncbi:MAG: glycosyltransferase [Candidatus Rokuibacteriota bacterium]
MAGAPQSAHALLRMLARRGHPCEAVAIVDRPRGRRGATSSPARAPRSRDRLPAVDARNGYPVYRCAPMLFHAVLEDRLRHLRPDLVVTQLAGSPRIAAQSLAAGVPTIVLVHSHYDVERGYPSDDRVLFVSASRFVAGLVREGLGRESPVCYPLVVQSDYGCRTRRPRYVTFVGPVPVKGLEVALAVAERLPHRRFLFVESWPLEPADRRRLAKRLARTPNVILRPRTRRMASIYRETALLLVPSQYPEAFGRVIVEAQISGIPVVASDIGGIPEAIGAGGILLAPGESPNVWAATVETILADPARRHVLATAAQLNVTRLDLAPEALADGFLAIARVHIARAAENVRRARQGACPAREGRAEAAARLPAHGGPEFGRLGVVPACGHGSDRPQDPLGVWRRLTSIVTGAVGRGPTLGS